ncbi:MAG: HNH endonuclease [Acidimicrobiia bacterium]|nr:HNH endonuclease [Acidimicrobiia bacterium]
MVVAEVVELDRRLDRYGGLRERVEELIADLEVVPIVDRLALSTGFQNRLVALDARTLATQAGNGAGDRELQHLAGRGRTRSSGEAIVWGRRAKALAQNPALGEDLASGALTPAGLDAIAAVADKSEGAAARDELLVERVKAALPDQARAITRHWLDDHTSPDEHEKRWQRQRRLRSVSRYYSRDGLDGIRAEGDRETIDHLWSIIKAESKHLYHRDGGRDLPPDKHPRTRKQRLFDAFTDAFGTRTGQGLSRAAQIYVTLTLDELCDEATKARLVGGGTIPPSLLEQYLANSPMPGVLFDGNGHVLWHGRNKRYATPAQLSALTARDQGCVLCDASPSDCDGHHLIPYNAPAHGKTNTDELALVCTDCHHHIHTTNQTLWCEPDPRTPGHLSWHLRPATPDEIPP